MDYKVDHAIDLLQRTPFVLKCLLTGISDVWLHNNEGGESWSPFQVVGHLIEGERHDWIPRAQLILSEEEDKRFKPFDRFSQEEWIKGKTIEQLLDQFEHSRMENLNTLESMELDDEKLNRIGIHPEFGEVTLSQHLSTWVAHDHAHLSQISRVLAKQYQNEVGPWAKYLSILN